MSECPHRNDPDFDINDVLDKWDEYRNEKPKTTKSDRDAEAKAMDAKQKAGKWMIRVKSGTCDDIREKDINTLLDLIEDDDWMLEWPQNHLRECTVGGLQSEADMQALSTRIRRKMPDLQVQSCGRLPDYQAPAAVETPGAGMTASEKGRMDQLENDMQGVKADVAELKDQNTLMTKRMDKMDASLTTLHKNRKQDRDILKFIASKMDKDKTFESDNDDDEDDSLTPWDNVDETPGSNPGWGGNPNPTPTPLAQRPQAHTDEAKGPDIIPETQQSPDPSRRLSMSDNTPMEVRDSRKRLQASPGTRPMKSGYVHVPPRTNVNEGAEWAAYRVILLSAIDAAKWWGKLVDFSPKTPPILVEKSCWYEDEEESTAALASRMAGKRPRTGN